MHIKYFTMKPMKSGKKKYKLFIFMAFMLFMVNPCIIGQPKDYASNAQKNRPAFSASLLKKENLLT
jgi:hypothetical protein